MKLENWIFMLILVALAALVGMNLAEAETFEWDAPTRYTDGTPLDPAKDIKRYKFYRDGQVGGNIEKPNATTAPPTTFNWTVPTGKHSYFVTAIDNLGRASDPSNVLTIDKTVPTATPLPTATPTREAKLSPPEQFRALN